MTASSSASCRRKACARERSQPKDRIVQNAECCAHGGLPSAVQSEEEQEEQREKPPKPGTAPLDMSEAGCRASVDGLPSTADPGSSADPPRREPSRARQDRKNREERVIETTGRTKARICKPVSSPLSSPRQCMLAPDALSWGGGPTARSAPLAPSPASLDPSASSSPTGKPSLPVLVDIGANMRESLQ